MCPWSYLLYAKPLTCTVDFVIKVKSSDVLNISLIRRLSTTVSCFNDGFSFPFPIWGTFSGISCAVFGFYSILCISKFLVFIWMMKKFANMVLRSQNARRSKFISKMAAAEERFCDLNRRFISARKTRFFGKHGKYFIFNNFFLSSIT